MRCPGTRSPQSIQISMRRGAVYPRGTSAARRSNVSFSPRPSPTARSASAAISCVTSQVYLDRQVQAKLIELLRGNLDAMVSRSDAAADWFRVCAHQLLSVHSRTTA